MYLEMRFFYCVSTKGCKSITNQQLTHRLADFSLSSLQIVFSRLDKRQDDMDQSGSKDFLGV